MSTSCTASGGPRVSGSGDRARSECGGRWIGNGAKARVAVVDQQVRASVQHRHEHCGGRRDIYFSVQKERFVLLGHSFEISERGTQSLDGRLPRGT